MSADLTPRQLLDSFVLEHIDSQPLAKRAMLYRAFAAESQGRAVKMAANALADECEAIARHHQQLVLDFKREAL